MGDVAWLSSTRADVPTLLSDQTFTIRPEDYDQAEDFIAAILYAQYGRKEDAGAYNMIMAQSVTKDFERLTTK